MTDGITTLRPRGFNFKSALDHLLAGRKIRSEIWPNPDDYAYMSGNSDPEKSILMLHRDGEEHKWTLAAVDMLAEDWEVV